MSFKVCRDGQGIVICYGPNDDGYEPSLPYSIEEIIPSLPTHVPSQVTMRQARRALLNAGLLTTTNAAIAGMVGAEGGAARIDWEYSQVVMRNWPLVAALMPILGLTRAQVDQLFITANNL